MTEIEDSVNRVIGSTAFDIIERVLGKTENDEKPFFRVKNLRPTEACALLNVWNDKAIGNLRRMKIVVAADSPEMFPAEYRADADKSITYYRDNNEYGLIYVETKIESDAQGLKNIFSLTDRNFLDSSFNEDDYSVPSRIVHFAWVEAGGSGPIASLLESRIVEVLHLVHPYPLSLSVRMFTTFSLAIVRERVSMGGSLEPVAIDQLVGRHLTELNMFPDEEWHHGASDARIARRLAQNALHAELASSGSSDLDTDKLIEQINATVFKSKKGDEFSGIELKTWRQHCVDYCEEQTLNIRSEIPYYIFEQLFRKDVKGLPLGDRVAGEIADEEPTRELEFEELLVRDALNRRSQDDAQRFLESESEGQRPLRDLLSKQTLRMLDKVANPHPETFTNPLIKFAEIASDLRERMGVPSGSMRFKVNAIIDDEESNPMVGLFSFIYGKTLRDVMISSKDDINGIELQIDEKLLQVVAPPNLDDAMDELDANKDESSEMEITWKPVAFEFQLEMLDGSGRAESDTAYQWEPDARERVSLLWIALVSADAATPTARLSLPEEDSLNEWISKVTDRKIGFNTAAVEHFKGKCSSSTVLNRIVDLRNQFAVDTAEKGLSGVILENYFIRWSELLFEAKVTHVPDGKADPLVDAILHMDCIDLESGESVLMLPSHPFRLRWLSRYLKLSEELLLKALAGELPLNRQNSRRYMQWMSDLSPQQQPAVHCNRLGKLVFAAGELGWTEEFSPLEDGRVSADTGSLDPHATNEIAAQVTAYLEAHPYKRDGLSLLIVLPSGSKFPSDLVRQIRKGDWKDLSADITVLAPKALWDAISESFEELPSENRLSSGRALFPPVVLGFINLEASKTADQLLEGVECDLAIVPKFLQDQVDVQENTEPCDNPVGFFDPLMDKPTHVYGGSKGGAISVSMRPSKTDAATDAWSSMVIRQHRTRPVAPSQPANTDFAELKINFAKMAAVFEQVHRVAHWVITLEKYISREQIEMLEPRPDILTVRENVGASGLYTLIVSSQHGRHFVISRLSGKLRRIVDDGGNNMASNGYLKILAGRIYDETRLIAPRLALQAMGISRVTEEIVGLTMARHLAQRYKPSCPQNGVVVWVSLDDHPNWFNGTSAVRADLLRITLRNEDDGMVVDFLAVEGKLRLACDPHGEDQVLATLDLIQDTLPHGTSKHEPIDARLWREHFAAAMEAVAPEARTFFGSADQMVKSDRVKLPPEMRERFRNGEFSVGDVSGLYSLCRHDKTGDFIMKQGRDARLCIANSYRNHVIGLVDQESDNGLAESACAVNPLTKPKLDGKQPEEEDCTLTSTLSSSGRVVSGKPTSVTTMLNSVSCTIAADDNGHTQVILKSEESASSTKPGKLNLEELERRYQKILDTFGHFGVDVRCPDGEVRFEEGPASVLYRVKPSLGVDPKKLSARADSLKLELGLEEDQSIRFSIHRGFSLLDVPKRDDERYFVRAEELWENWERPNSELETPIGVDRRGHTVSINFSSSNSPHLLIGGTSGSGKSEALNTILHGLVKHYTAEELRLQLIDPKGIELQDFEVYPHLQGEIGLDAKNAMVLLTNAVEQMQERYKLFREEHVRSLSEYNSKVPAKERLPWWLIVLDEYADLTTEKDAKEEIEANLKRLAQKARAAGIHVIIATQNPKADVISTNLRSNLPAQLALRVRSGIESQIVMGETGAETLIGKGDAFLNAEGKMTRVQCAIVGKQPTIDIGSNSIQEM